MQKELSENDKQFNLIVADLNEYLEDEENDYGEYGEDDYKETIKKLKKLAADNHAPSQNQLALLYSLGRFVKQNDKEARKWFLKAATQGYVEAQVNAGYLYMKGGDVKVDYKKAYSLFLQAAEQGLAEAQYNVAYLLSENYVHEFDRNKILKKWLLKAVEQEYGKAQCLLGKCYFQGDYGFKKNYEKALHFLTLASKDKECCCKAYSFIGLMYFDGYGVKKDYNKAFDFLIKAAVQDHIGAQVIVSSMYANGQGVEKDEVMADFWQDKLREAQSEYEDEDDEYDEESFHLLVGALNDIITKRSN